MYSGAGDESVLDGITHNARRFQAIRPRPDAHSGRKLQTARSDLKSRISAEIVVAVSPME